MIGGPASRLRQTPAEAMISLGLVAWGLVEVVGLASATPLGWRVALALAATVPLAWRGQWPAAVLAWSCAIVAFQEVADVLPASGVTPYQCLSLATYAFAASAVPRRWVHAVGWPLALAYPAFLLAMDTDDSYGLANGAGLAAGQVVLLLVGLMVRRRREAARAADEALRRAGESGEARLAQAVAEERAAILRELGSIVVDDLRTVQRLLREADGAAGRGDAGATRAACERVQGTVAAAVVDMRRLLGVLRAGEAPGDGPADDPQIEAYDRAQRRRDRIGDALVALTIGGVLAIDVATLSGGRAVAGALSGVLVMVVPLAWRRRYPGAVAAALIGGLLARQLAGVSPDLPVSLMPAVLVAAYAAGAFGREPRRALLTAAGIAAGGIAVAALLIGQGGSWSDLPVVLFLVGCGYAVGDLVRENDGRLVVLREDAAQLAADYRARRAAALERERLAVARELHDVVAHGVSLIGVQAGAAAATAGRDDAATLCAIAVAGDALAQTGEELGQLTALLGGGPVAPPGIADVGALVAAAARTGQRVRFVQEGAVDGVADGVGASVYRIVQEALTNARKHAPGAATSVRVAVDGDGVTLEVTTGITAAASPAVPGTGRGIAGMRERARLLGGRLEAGFTGGGFTVRAELPAHALYESAAAEAAA